jgi:peptidoglycan hydrolase CwlO-like protein
MIRKIIYLFVFASIFIAINHSARVLAAECDNKSGQEKVDCLESKVSSLKNQANTLSSQISIMDNQIDLTEARIDANKREILDLTVDIDTTTKKISTLEDSLDEITEVLLNRIVATYEAGSVQPIEIIVSSKSASSLMTRLNYLRIAQAHDKRLLYDIQQAKNDYANQKEIFETKKDKIESLKLQLEAYSKSLEEQKVAKEHLLLATKDDEVVYQRLLDQARAERAVVFGGGDDVYLRDVSQGDEIGFIASHSISPGCSSGAHLHFEVQKDGSIHKPDDYLRSANFSYDYPEGSYGYYGTINPAGDLRWPLDEPIIVHQGYGSHGFAQSFYSGGIHNGIDIDSSSSVVRAVKDGKLYGGSYNCSNGKLFYSKIEHEGGLITWYLHMVAS